MSFFYASMNSILKILSASVVLSASALFSLNLFGHSASFNHVRPLSLSGLRYRYKSAVSISAASVQFTFHIPRPSNPRWGTFTVIDYEQKDTACHVSFAKLEATLWFFPLLFRVSAGPWMAVKFEDFRVRVWSSTSTPEWVQRIRVNLVGAVLKGQILRCDHFKTTVGLSSLTDTKVAANQDSSTSVEKPGVDRPDFQDEVRVTTYVEGYDVINWLNRLYSFGNLSCQLRKDWIDLRGSFVLIGKEIRWTKVQPPTEKQGRTPSFWWQLVCSIMMLPSDFIRICSDPSLLFDLHITRLDATFDRFRIRDAELLRQSCGMMQTALVNRGSSFRNIFADFLLHSFTK